ncbi:DoxX family protein [Verrucomicrobiaceae bacterium 227]
MKRQTIISWVLQLTVVVIIGQTLPSKFGAHPGSVALFTELGMEPQGRILTGTLELLACFLLLIPTSVVYGALLTAGLMSGALLAHFTKLGFAGGNAFGYFAILTLILSLIILYLRRTQLPIIHRMFGKK